MTNSRNQKSYEHIRQELQDMIPLYAKYLTQDWSQEDKDEYVRINMESELQTSLNEQGYPDMIGRMVADGFVKLNCHC